MKRGSVHDWGVAVGLFNKKPKDGLMRPVAPQPPVRRPQPARRTTPTAPSLTFRIAVNPPVKAKPGAHAWVERAGRAEVGRCLISGGNFYFGNGLPAVGRQYMEEPALVNPKLPVDFAHPDWSGEGLHYWPSYDSISPSERAAFVTWLASSRDDPNTPTGFIFLYFYGLERRALVDLRPLPDANVHLALIAAEVKRLRSIYSQSGSFSSYSSDFLDVIEFLMTPNDESAWVFRRLHTLDVRMEHDRETNVEAIPR